MDESLICECGNTKFWFFWDFVRCTKCFNEYKKIIKAYTQPKLNELNEFKYPTFEYWLRRFDKEKNQYHDNWETSPLTFNKKK